MSFRIPRWATGVLVVVAVVLVASRCWAHFYELGPSKDEWGLKYECEVTAEKVDKLNVNFTLSDQGRLKPIYSVSVIAFSDLRKDGGRTYLVNSAIELKPNKDGKLTGQVQIGKEFTDRAMIRFLTTTFDGKPQTAGARYYQVPLKKFMKKAPAAAAKTPSTAASSASAASPAATVASPPSTAASPAGTKVTK